MRTTIYEIGPALNQNTQAVIRKKKTACNVILLANNTLSAASKSFVFPPTGLDHIITLRKG